MQVLVVGASGAIGTQLIPQLRQRGHEVTGSSRSPTEGRTAARARRRADRARRPEHSGCPRSGRRRPARRDHLPGDGPGGCRLLRNLDRTFAQTNRLRTEGTDILLAAAREAGVRRFVAQSFAPYRYAREGGPVKTEDDSLDPAPPATARQTFAAMNHLDQAVTSAGGIALRYGGFYGNPDALIKAVRKRQYPIIGNGAGVMPFIHLHDAAAATVLALDHDGPALYNITDDEPAPARDWMPVLADALGAKPPRHIPPWLARLVMGESLAMMTESRGASNTKAKKELGWALRYPSWRQGFPATYSPAPTA